ncbi:hypothetical protein PQX77_012004 [Marasmius sp. AFHP31]|nr:hypothetical protein PQX77_012004 [Marasmius sp. AFHP31]
MNTLGQLTNVIDLTESDDDSYTPSVSSYPEVSDLLTRLYSLLQSLRFLDFEDELVQWNLHSVDDIAQLAPGFLEDVVHIPSEAASLIMNHATTLSLHFKGKAKAPPICVKEEKEN